MKHTRVKLIRDFFNPVSMTEMKALTKDDMSQLASAIARAQGIPQDECDFEFVAY